MKLEDYSKYYIQGSDHYLIPKDVFMELFNEMSNWKEDTKKYKEVIDELEKYLKEESKYDEYKDVFYREHMGYVLDKLKYLKEGNKDE